MGTRYLFVSDSSEFRIKVLRSRVSFSTDSCFKASPRIESGHVARLFLSFVRALSTSEVDTDFQQLLLVTSSWHMVN